MRVMPHQGAWESHAQGEAVQVDGLAGGSARDVHLLNWRKAATGEPCDAETVTHGSERLRHEAAYIAVGPGNRTQPDVLPSVLYRDMQQE